jgi:phosphate transport system permease protein
MAAVIANEFTEATGELYLSALVEIGLVLFLLTIVVHLVAKGILGRMVPEARKGAAR